MNTTNRQRLADLWYDLRHPWLTLLREATLEYCRLTGARLDRWPEP